MISFASAVKSFEFSLSLGMLQVTSLTMHLSLGFYSLGTPYSRDNWSHGLLVRELDDQLVESIRTQYLPLPDETIVFSGHGPETTIGYERRKNPFLQ